MKVFSIFSCLLAILCIFWLSEFSLNLLEQHCQIETSITKQIIVAIKKVFGVQPPDPHWLQPLCGLRGHKLTGIVIVLCNVLITVACILFFKRRSHRKNELVKNVAEYLDTNENETFEIISEQPQEFPSQLLKRSSDELEDDLNSKPTKRLKPNHQPFKHRARKTRRNRQQRKSWFDGYIFIPHTNTEKTVYRAALLGPVNDCMKLLLSLLTATFARRGVSAKDVKWSYNTDSVGTMTYLTGESDWMKVEVEVAPGDGINICIHRVVKVEGLLRFVQSRSYQLTYMGLTCVDQCSNTMYGAGWDL